MKRGTAPAPRLLLRRVVSIAASSISLLVAASGLAEVRDVVRAMQAADRSQAAQGSAAGNCGCDGWAPCDRSLAPRYESRPVIHPEPRYEPRPVYHPTPRVEPMARGGECASPPLQVVVKKADAEQPLEAPWKSVPWKNPLPSAPKVKLAPPHPDISHKGMILDFFI